MSSRRRVGVALVLDPPVREQVEGLRRALGDPSLERIPPHVTLVPPVNLRRGDLAAALAVLRGAAAAQPGPLELFLGPVSTFAPVNPVLYLAVGGDLERLRRLRDDVFRAPLERTLTWPWVPHATLADGIDEDRIAAAMEALTHYAVLAPVDRLVLLEEGPGRVWSELADAELGPLDRVGTGGLGVELTQGRLVDPETAPEVAAGWAGRLARSGPGGPPVVVTARREGEVVGAGVLWADRSGARVSIHVEPAVRGQGIGTLVLRRLEAAGRRAGWPGAEAEPGGDDGFYRRRTDWVRAGVG